MLETRAKALCLTLTLTLTLILTATHNKALYLREKHVEVKVETKGPFGKPMVILLKARYVLLATGGRAALPEVCLSGAWPRDRPPVFPGDEVL